MPFGFPANNIDLIQYNNNATINERWNETLCVLIVTGMHIIREGKYLSRCFKSIRHGGCVSETEITKECFLKLFLEGNTELLCRHASNLVIIFQALMCGNSSACHIMSMLWQHGNQFNPVLINVLCVL